MSKRVAKTPNASPEIASRDIAACPQGAFLILPHEPSPDGAENIPVALLLSPSGHAVALCGCVQENGVWKIPEGAPLTETAGDARKALSQLRTEARNEIERLIRFLDAVQGDSDLEPAGDELDDDQCDGEDNGDGEPSDEPEDGGDHEPSMGWVNEGSQSSLGPGGDHHTGAEEEPSLGSFDRMTDQRKSWQKHSGPSIAWHSTDAEVEDDTGIADIDGLAEQTGGRLAISVE